jgi:two-component system LytT family response regulator
VEGRAVTQPIRALIVDDEPAARASIRALVADDPQIVVVGECADGRSALHAIRDQVPHLLFLDVQMPEMDGFTMLRQLDGSALPVIVFTTAYDQYALRAFDVHALDYLLKPFDDERFRQALDHAKEQVRRGRLGAVSRQLRDLLDESDQPSASRDRYLKRLVIKSAGRMTVLTVRDIDWIEAEGDYLRLHVGRGHHVLHEAMRSLERQMDPARFVRIHRSTIVNVERIKELQPYSRGEYVVILHDGTRLKLARGSRAKLESALGARS